MVTIPQHGPRNELNDMRTFAEDLSQLPAIETWRICIDWCTGERALEIERLSQDGLELSNAEFWSLYKGIHQTIDGEFTALAAGQVICTFTVVDSFYWEIQGPEPFELHMQQRYGLFHSPNFQG
ncbi:hypothetical protein P3T65_07980 [Pseudomonas nitroreducens]|uniref:hypothetical protein n=1 Tax=Pseudomonas nitroreducens TaxID=46680 RepID=UPI0023F82A14|nr:hypothetical protein [Pseudomonas nitroreducens]WEW99641.1 hypothetical protein P3T65_07980 [Pseudomonas nitroreducens]